MPRPAKILVGALVGYVLLVVAFESMIGFLQPEQGQVLTITTTGDDGAANDRVLAMLDDGGTVYVSANHWPRAWYREALANPAVQVSIKGVKGAYRAVPIDDETEHARLDDAFAHPFLFRFITGFPPRLFLRLDPEGVGA